MEKGRPRILVVDDEQIIRDFLSDVLRGEGYEVTVSNAEEGLKKISESQYDLILTDLRMPRVEGIDILKLAKKLNLTTDVIVMTGYASIGQAVEAMKQGASDYITKPLNIDHIRIVVKRTLGQRRLVKETKYYKELSITDSLTGLYNHRFFQDQLAIEISRSQRYNRFLSLLLLDIDNFKVFNDAYGHRAGDLILKKVALVLRKNARLPDLVCRYGGEEFAIIVPEASKEEALVVGKRLRVPIEFTRFECAEALPSLILTMSIGLATFPTDATIKEELVEKADQALYRAKDRGRDQLVVWGDQTP